MKILSGDIGGTHARLALCAVENNAVRRDIQEIYDSRRYDSLADIAREFIADNHVEVHTACFGVPGPVQGRRARVTNLPWEVDADELERNLGIHSIHLLNDLEATAHGLATLSEADFHELRPGASGAVGNAGLLAAGRGLGEAGLFWDGRRHRPFACEGGHVDFAPSNDDEAELLQFLRAKHGAHVSWERVVSGPGIVGLYEFLRDKDPAAESKAMAEAIVSGDAGEEISKAALRGDDALALRAVKWFLGLYGAEAGNLALKVLATGGIYLGGGIAPKLARLIPESDFVDRFQAKGRMQGLLERIGLSIVMNDRAALQGAAHYGSRRARGDQG
ncbi:MAG: glucokinase [Deltaproteobacteria bacterium]|nr:glucokinase [Deltaproteobacteria bacterium]